jgi:hypothetical protein
MPLAFEGNITGGTQVTVKASATGYTPATQAETVGPN